MPIMTRTLFFWMQWTRRGLDFENLAWTGLDVDLDRGKLAWTGPGRGLDFSNFEWTGTTAPDDTRRLIN